MFKICRLGPGAQNPVDVCGCRSLSEGNSLVANLVGENFFAKRRAIVWRVWLVTDCGDWAKVAESSKRFRCAQSTHGCANDDDRLGH
jgi:hypothetical protein